MLVIVMLEKATKGMVVHASDKPALAASFPIAVTQEAHLPFTISI